MSYVLQAIISKKQFELLPGLVLVKFVSLEHDLTMIPLTDNLFAKLHETAPEGQDLIPGFENLTTLIAERLSVVSENQPVAYIEAEFFGGAGDQSAMMWNNGNVVFESVNSQDAINQVLRLFGVTAGKEIDEFAAVGLGRHRFTDDW